MISLRRILTQSRRGQRAVSQSVHVFIGDVSRGLFEVGHSTLALVGFLLVVGAVFAASRADVRHEAEVYAFGWLQSRHEARHESVTGAEPLIVAMPAQRDAAERATAVDMRELTRQQVAVAQWLSRRYRVAPEPISRLVKEAWQVGRLVGMDPALILAVMAVESNFNPFAQSPVGAQGLMQVMTRVHNEKYEPFGGHLAAFDPVTNLRVGVQVLKECITRAGGLEAGLRYYVGAANLALDGGYANKVLSERDYLSSVAGGRNVALNAPLNTKPSATIVAKPPAAKDPMVVDPQNADKAPGAEQVATARRMTAT